MRTRLLVAAGLALSVCVFGQSAMVGQTSAFAASSATAEIKAQGSDTTLGVVKQLATAFATSGGASITVEGGGSSRGIKACLDGQVPLAFSSRPLKEEEKKAGLIAAEYGFDAVAVIVHKSNPIDELSIEQLRDIFSGKADKWPDGRPLTVFNRNEDSATREIFREGILGKEGNFTDKAAIKHDGVIISTVARIPTAIAFTSAGEVQDSVKVIRVAGVAPNAENVRNKTYPLSKTLFFVTKGEPNAEAKAFIDFARSDKGQRLVVQNNLIPLSPTTVAGAPESK